MSRRKQRWLARIALLLIAAVPFVGLSFIPVHMHNHWGLYGRLHNVAEVLLVLMSYVVGGLLAMVAIVCAFWLGNVALDAMGEGIKTLWRMAWQ